MLSFEGFSILLHPFSVGFYFLPFSDTFTVSLSLSHTCLLSVFSPPPSTVSLPCDARVHLIYLHIQAGQPKQNSPHLPIGHVHVDKVARESKVVRVCGKRQLTKAVSNAKNSFSH